MRNLTELCSLFEIDTSDKAALQSFQPIIHAQVQEIVDEWYQWLTNQSEFEEFFENPVTLKRVKQLQVVFWEQFFVHELNEEYFESRINIGKVHARIGLSQELYLAGLDHMIGLIISRLDSIKLSQKNKNQIRRSMNKLAHLDVAIILQSYERLVMEKIEAQSRSLLEMSTPVTQLWSGLLLLPVVGLIDSKRAQDIMDNSLMKISETQAVSLILDISGVGFVDTAVANHLIKITKATKLMGCECIISGLSPAVAETIVGLGIDVGEVKTTANMRAALDVAFSRLHLEVSQKKR